MFEKLKRLYASEKLMAVELANAVIKGWVIETQKQEILSEER